MSAFDTIRAALQAPWDADSPLSESEYEAVLTALAEAEAERDTLANRLGEPCAECGHIDWREGSPGPFNLLERAEKAEATVARQGEALRRWALDLQAVALGQLPSDASLERWLLATAGDMDALAGSDVPPADTGEPLPARHADGHYDTCAIRAGASCDCPGAREDATT